ncbi:uncharacterized protein LOC124692812 [Lolium rigidum]|uniref:uncharacterized protein LOC124692812 n=1 Tax=Lolium rigidum TaxID=89674 RepID=UPI001F5D6CCC|nr:uncharacterized protein LOC124692812 [Lolium rigidum]
MAERSAGIPDRGRSARAVARGSVRPGRRRGDRSLLPPRTGHNLQNYTGQRTLSSDLQNNRSSGGTAENLQIEVGLLSKPACPSLVLALLDMILHVFSLHFSCGSS